ncbi:MAG: hypothetical protein COB66_00870, partial [Coxiella sp. (in: Bacteria)]
MAKGVKSAWDSVTGKDSADAALEASAIAAGAEGDKLDYLKEQNATSSAIKDAGLQQLAGINGIAGFEQYGNQEDLMKRAEESAFYTGGMEAGNEAILRSNNATGGMRGGGTAADIANYSSNL